MPWGVRAVTRGASDRGRAVYGEATGRSHPRGGFERFRDAGGLPSTHVGVHVGRPTAKGHMFRGSHARADTS